MKQFKKLKLYEPDVKIFPSALYLRDEKGKDWYSVIESFSPDTLKIAYRDDGVIVSCEKDASGLFPVNLSVAEIAETSVTVGQSITDGSWRYIDGKLQQIRNYLADAEAERDNRMAEVTTRINWLEDAQKDGDISADEETELTALRAYRTALRRLNLSNVTDKESYNAIDWPSVPVWQ
ncbi:TPA: tail fiber assembly protein [Citrobacter freundii]|nr:tail fiber assembly protein [Citrobacter freundii]